MVASRIVDSLDEGERKEERNAQKYTLERDGTERGEEGTEERRRFKGEKENQGWLEFCKGLQTISAGLSGSRLSK